MPQRNRRPLHSIGWMVIHPVPIELSSSPIKPANVRQAAENVRPAPTQP
jgi:hypothetical protein